MDIKDVLIYLYENLFDIEEALLNDEFQYDQYKERLVVRKNIYKDLIEHIQGGTK